MLQRLFIQNYAIIEEIEIEFTKGLVVITGETGAGKSILMGALGLILGERAETGVLVNKEKKLIVEGVDRLHGATYRVMSDRIEAGSYACAAAMAGGDVELVGAKASEMDATLDALRQAGVTVEDTGTGIRVKSDGELKPLTISTAPYPGFATDMQAQFMAMLCMADGASVLTETIFENRYMHVPELNRMGAHIETKGRTAIVHGVKKLTGAPVMATDLRASMSLVIAGLVAEGETHVSRLYHLDRGYEHIEAKLAALGAKVSRVK